MGQELSSTHLAGFWQKFYANKEAPKMKKGKLRIYIRSLVLTLDERKLTMWEAKKKHRYPERHIMVLFFNL